MLKSTLYRYALVFVPFLVSLFASTSALAQTIIRVDAQSTATTPDGTTWALAYPKLQDALAAVSGNTHIWVRGKATSGLSYRPDQAGGSTSNNPNATFAMIKDVHLYGGFPDTGNPGFIDRNPATYLTILTGEIGTGNDFSDNSYHVVTADDADMTDINCRLDGFTIMRGNADTDDSSAGGGGISVANSADLRIDRCIITDNRSGDGGYGAGIQVRGSNPVITRCVISNNQNLDNEVLYGGGIVIHENSGTSSNPVRILDCTISGNRAAHGGGISVKQTSHARIVNCQINGNSINPTSGNSAPFGGGLGVDRSTTSVSVINCTFSGNTAVRGGAFAQWGDASATSEIRNSILWGDTGTTDGAEIYVVSGSGTLTVDRCDIQNLSSSSGVSGSITSTNNISSDPLFVGSGNYHLRCGSPCINLSLDSVIPTDEFDLNGNAVTTERTPDRDLAWRVIGSAADMGSYEITGFCCPGDTNESGAVDVDDLLNVVNGWGANPNHAGNVSPDPCPDNVVDVNDLLAVITAGATAGMNARATDSSKAACRSRTPTVRTPAAATAVKRGRRVCRRASRSCASRVRLNIARIDRGKGSSQTRQRGVEPRRRTVFTDARKVLTKVRDSRLPWTDSAA